MSITLPPDISIKSGRTKVKMNWNPGTEKRLNEGFEGAQKFIDRETLRLAEPFTPRDTGNLIASGERATRIGSGTIQYDAPYDRRQYYENKGNGQRGARWLERVKVQYGEQIRKGAAQYVR